MDIKGGRGEWKEFGNWSWNTYTTVLKWLSTHTCRYKGNQSWIFIGRTDAEAQASVLGHLMWGADSLEKTLMLGKTGQEEKEAIKDELVGWRHWLNGHESEQTQGGSDGQRSLQFVGLPRVGHNLATEQQQYYLLNHFLLSEQIKKLRGKEAITG